MRRCVMQSGPHRELWRGRTACDTLPHTSLQHSSSWCCNANRLAMAAPCNGVGLGVILRQRRGKRGSGVMSDQPRFFVVRMPQFECPHCHTLYEVEHSTETRSFNCPKCYEFIELLPYNCASLRAMDVYLSTPSACYAGTSPKCDNEDLG